MAELELENFSSSLINFDTSIGEEKLNNSHDEKPKRKQRRSKLLHGQCNLRRSQRLSMTKLIKSEMMSDSEHNDSIVKQNVSKAGALDAPSLNEEENIRTGKLLGATEINGDLKFIFEWSDSTTTLVPNEIAKQKYTYQVLEFYESRFYWETCDDKAQ